MATRRSIVQAPMLPVFNTGHHRSLGRGIAGQFVGDHHAWSDAVLLEQLS